MRGGDFKSPAKVITHGKARLHGRVFWVIVVGQNHAHLVRVNQHPRVVAGCNHSLDAGNGVDKALLVREKGRVVRGIVAAIPLRAPGVGVNGDKVNGCGGHAVVGAIQEVGHVLLPRAAQAKELEVRAANGAPLANALNDGVIEDGVEGGAHVVL